MQAHIRKNRGLAENVGWDVNCHNDVINLLLNMGVDIDKLNCEGMSALAVCHVIYYPFQSLHTTLAEPPVESQVSRSPSACGSSSQISQVGVSAETHYDRPQTTDQTAGGLMKHMSHHSQVSKDSELITEHCPGLNEPETPADSGHQLVEERDEDRKETQREGEVQEREESSHREGEEGKTVDECDQPREYESEGKSKETDTESGMEDVELREEVEEDVEERVRHVHIEDEEERGSVEHSIQVLDGHIVLGSVQWKERRAKDKDKDLAHDQTFDSTCSVSSYNIQVTEEVMQHAAEALSRTGFPQRPDTQETVRRMAAMKMEHRRRLKTIELLLERGADPNASKVPMPVLFLAVMAADTEAVRRLLLCGARTDIPLPPERKGLYPLHVAAALPGSAGPTITELLLHTIPDPDAQACDQDEVYEPDKVFREAQKTLSTNQGPHPKEGGRTALHVACQKDSDYQLNMLAKAGADILMPVMVGDVVGTAVDYAHFSFNQDSRIANTPFHALNMRERETFKARRHLLNMMRDLLRRRVGQLEAENREQQLTLDGTSVAESLVDKGANRLPPSCKGQPHVTEKHRKPLFKFCYHCGRSVSVKLTPCSRCHKVFYCSTSCKLKAWDEIHKEECIRASASAADIQKRVTFKSQRGPRPTTVTLKSKTAPRPVSARLTPQSLLRPLGMAEKIPESQVNLKENYSYN
ncbi:hypothetical protein INR49_023962 [Caranx melampygus]|nr:hypothetical protein INR49_023962 [Caranx melampygus]